VQVAARGADAHAGGCTGRLVMVAPCPPQAARGLGHPAVCGELAQPVVDPAAAHPGLRHQVSDGYPSSGAADSAAHRTVSGERSAPVASAVSASRRPVAARRYASLRHCA
jgi:hypothetical protein